MQNLPNILTLSRIAVIPALIASFFVPGDLGNWIAFGIFTLAAITDYFDGYFARTFKASSQLGKFLDPIADKLIVASVIVLLSGFGVIKGLHLLAAIIILCREILVSGLREFLSDLKVSVPVTRLAKWKTAVQLVALSTLLIGDAAPPWFPALDAGLVLLWLAAVLTLYTGYDYLRAGLKHF